MDKSTVNRSRLDDRIPGPPSAQKLAEGAAHPRLVDEKRVMAVPALEHNWLISADAAGRVTSYEPLLSQRKEPVGFDAHHEKGSR
jgi:hypothetical protein